MAAVAELVRFATDNSHTLDDEYVAAFRILEDRLPQCSKDEHRLCIQKLEALLELTRIDKRGDSEEDESDERQAMLDAAFQRTFEELHNITGNPRAFSVYLHAWMEVRSRPARIPLLNAALLTTAVSSFEVLVSSLVREFFGVRPEALRSTEAKYTLSDIEGFKTIDEFREYCADRQVDSLLFGGLDDWVAWFNKQLKITSADFTDDFDTLREIFQRRHLFVHNGGIVNRQYLVRMAGMKDLPRLGAQLVVNKAYCEAAIDVITGAGVLLGAATMKKVIKSVESTEGHPADTLVQEISFEMLTEQRFDMTNRLISAVIDGCTSDYSRQVMKVNRWIAKRELDGLDSIKADLETWQVDVLHPNFKLAQLTLLEKFEEALKLTEKLRASGDLSLEAWLTWPLFRRLRSYQSETIHPDSQAAD